MTSSRRTPGTAAPSRRAVLGAGALTALGLLGGCRVRLEDDAPRVPGIPTREPTEDEGLLLSAWHDATELLRMSRAVGAPAASAARLHATHVATFDQELRDRRVPSQVRSAVASGTPRAGRAATVPPSPTSTAGTDATEAAGISAVLLAGREAAAWTDDAPAALGGAHVARVALLASFATCRAMLAETLGAPVRWPAWGLSPTSADAALIEAHREARYFLEVAAARTPPAQRDPFLAELTRVDGVVVLLQSRAGAPGPTAAPATGAPTSGSSAEAGPGTTATTPGSQAPVPPGYPLPFPVGDPAAARRLVTYALHTLELGCGAAWPAAAGDTDAVTTVSRLLHDTLRAGSRWGVPLRAFPGLAP